MAEVSFINSRLPETPNFLKPYNFETSFNHDGFTAALERRWSWVLYLSAVYVFSVHHGQRWMADKKPFQLKKVLILWNFLLVLFSVAVFARMLPELRWQWSQNGFQDTLCNFGSQKSITELWGVLFAFSKIFEFGDTLFLILTKKPVIFLHWFHHASVAIYGFFVGDITDPASRWFVLVNSFIHTLMYSYYGLKAMGVKIPRKTSVAITTLQICQMAFGIYINVVTSSWKAAGMPCERLPQHIQAASMIYSAYFILFANFFYQTYLAKKDRTSRLQKLKQEQ